MKQTLYLLLITVITGLSSCKKFLDVKPEDSVQEEVLYSSEQGFQIHLNGIYLALTEEALYGGQLTMEMLEVLGQRYNISTLHSMNDLASYTYTSTKVKPKLASAWNGLYREIANVNTLLEKADEHVDAFTKDNYNLIKGETLGLRAFLHFDALRLFGPMYKTDSTGSKLIPYYTAKTTVASDLLTAKEVVEKILTDLKEAETYLKNDPIITVGRTANGSDLFTTRRNQRMNYYAVKLLQARVYLYANRKVEALDAAKAVMAVQPAWFPFIQTTSLQSTTGPDRTFSSELVFAMFDNNLKEKYEKYFDPKIADSNFLAPLASRLDKVSENSTNDLRFYPQIWTQPSDGAKSVKCFYKYAGMTDTFSRKYLVPLMRVSEAYLIAAESATVLADKFQYLNVVRNARNLTSLATGTQTTFNSELTKEYQKEFYGEGQLFFYYKRNGTTSIDNGSVVSTIAMNADKYVLPLPDSEILSRN
jgi:starch-binding outer membrane protein, SusD/RagB family